MSHSNEYSDDEIKLFNGRSVMNALAFLNYKATENELLKHIIEATGHPENLVQEELKRILHIGVASGFIMKNANKYLLPILDNTYQVDATERGSAAGRESEACRRLEARGRVRGRGYAVGSGRGRGYAVGSGRGRGYAVGSGRGRGSSGVTYTLKLSPLTLTTPAATPPGTPPATPPGTPPATTPAVITRHVRYGIMDFTETVTTSPGGTETITLYEE